MRVGIAIGSFLWKIYVAIVFSIFAILLYPFFLVILSNKKWKKKSFKLFIFWSWMMRVFCFYIVRKISNASLPEGPYVIVSNHTSYLDIFFMYSVMPKHPFLFLGKSEILSYPIISTYFKGLNIPVDRKDRRKSAMSLVMAKKAVAEGWSIVIFPEGGIPDDDNPKMIRFKQGAFNLAKSLNIPIVPMSFTNNFELFCDPLDFKGTARPGVSHLYIHPFLSREEVEGMEIKELSDKCFQIINEPILAEYPHLKNSSHQEESN
jgi:1-acyl-sn-glycerol-3-phosphate acyltransferase